MDYFQMKLRLFISEVEDMYNANPRHGWTTDSLVKLRHELITLLTKDQLKNFNHN